MRVFVTGATGFIGSAVVKELRAAGHAVLGLARSADKAGALRAAGAEVLAGTVDDAQVLGDGVARSDAVIHLAFNHDFSTFAANCENDRRVIGVLGAALAGTARPLVVTSGTAMANTVPGQPAREDGATVSSQQNPRAASEEAAQALLAQGLNVSVVRLPQVHDTLRQGLVSYAIPLYRAQGACFHVGDGGTRWPAAHVSDVARLYRLAVEKAAPGARYHAVAEEGVAFRDIAATLGRRLGLPVQSIAAQDAAARFGWLAMFATHDMPAASTLTRERLGWQPQGPGLLDDLAQLQLADA